MVDPPLTFHSQKLVKSTIISLFLGIESAAEIGEEVRNPERTIPRGIALACVLTAGVYVAISVTVLGLLGPQRLAASAAPLLDAARGPMGAFAAPVILSAAVVSILKTMNSTALVFSRAVFAMGRSGSFPAALGRIHPRFGTPHIALLACYTVTMAGLFMPPSLTFLLLAVNIPTMLKYICSSLSAVQIARRHPDVYARATFRPSRRMVMALGALGVLAGILIILAGIGADWRPYVLIGGWALVGTAYWYVSGRR